MIMQITIGKEKLFCQKRKDTNHTLADNGVNNGSFITKQWIPDMCCGNRPYNSQIRMCCFGKTISRNTMRCCPDGTILPIDTICRCHPQSIWVRKQLDEMSSIEKRQINLVKEIKTLITHTKTHMINLQEEIKTLDSQAQQLYEIFVSKINIDINDPTEAKNVIEMINFKYGNENKINMENENDLSKTSQISQKSQLKVDLRKEFTQQDFHKNIKLRN